MTQHELIVKLKAHIGHVKDIIDNKTLRPLSYPEKRAAIDDEIRLMYALIKGNKEE